MKIIDDAIRQVVSDNPRLYALLDVRARDFIDAPAVKSYDYYLKNINRLVRNVYYDRGGDFVGSMQNLVLRQMYDAVRQAWLDAGNEGQPPTEIITIADDYATSENQHIVDLRDAIDAGRKAEPRQPVAQYLDRASLWANRWTDAYNAAQLQINKDNPETRYRWVYGDTEHCETCARLNGIVASAADWLASGYKPQSPPNAKLDCGGWRCQCVLELTKDEATKGGIPK